MFIISGLFLNESRLLEGLQGILRSVLSSEPKLVSVTTPSFGCSRGYHLDSDSEGCGESLLSSDIQTLDRRVFQSVRSPSLKRLILVAYIRIKSAQVCLHLELSKSCVASVSAVVCSSRNSVYFLCFQSFVLLAVSPRRGCVICVFRGPIRTKRGGTSATGVPQGHHLLEHHLSKNVSVFKPGFIYLLRD